MQKVKLNIGVVDKELLAEMKGMAREAGIPTKGKTPWAIQADLQDLVMSVF